MHLSPCFHPVRIRVLQPDGRTRYQYVPCGKCESCINQKSLEWTNRLEKERQCWKYCVFFTLTYDEKNVPLYLYNQKDRLLLDPDTDECIDCSNLGFRLHAFLSRRHRIRHVSVRDVQLFMKRLRYFVSSINNSYESKQIRYYVVSEYGPTTLRPHYHGLLFFNSQETASHFDWLLHKSWTLGIVDWSFVQGSAASYCARYVNCTPALPKFLRLKETRPFSLCSKCPAIGTLQFETKEIFEIFVAGACERVEPDTKRQTFVNVPLSRQIASRLFPKIQGFSYLTHYDRVTLYGLPKMLEASSYEDFREKVLNLPCWFTDVGGFLNSLLAAPTEYPFRNYYMIASRVLNQCIIFDCTLDYYVSRIELFYKNKDYVKLREQIRFESELSKTSDLKYYLNIDPTFKDFLLHEKSYCSTAPWVKEVMSGLGIDLQRYLNDSTYRSLLDVGYSFDFMAFANEAKRFFKDNRKTKVKNDYLLAHPEYIDLSYIKPF